MYFAGGDADAGFLFFVTAGCLEFQDLFRAFSLSEPREFGGEVVTDAVSTTATVVSVDHVKRLVVLKRADGSSVTYKALPGALGFDVIQAGDKVKVSVAEELAVYPRQK